MWQFKVEEQGRSQSRKPHIWRKHNLRATAEQDSDERDDKHHLPKQTVDHKFRACKRRVAIDDSVVTGHPDPESSF